MKNTILAVVSTVMILFAVTITLTLYGRESRRQELEDHVATAMEQTMHRLENNENQFSSKEELVADFMQNYLVQIDSDSNVTVNVLAADPAKGLLSVEVIEEYQHPNQRVGRVSLQKTMIIDRWEQPEQSRGCRICFYCENEESGERELYKQYVIQTGDKILKPKDPETSDGKVFAGWKNEAGEVVELEHGIASEDAEYLAYYTE